VTDRKVALITGASRGIGAAAARVAAERGWSVVINYRSSRDVAESLVAEIVASGHDAICVPGNIAEEADVKAMVRACLDRYGRLDALINNAGILHRASKLQSFDLARWNDVMSVNATGAFLATREAIGVMALSAGGRGGVIVNVSSMAATLGGANEFVDYAASKGAMESMTLGLAKELAPEGIRVNAIRPGLILTDIHASSGDAARAERLASTVPMGRAGSAEEVARVIVWLMSDDASYVTGAIIPVSGGR
jgi:NAD(P)-dependent dehydrogenase (short-subunit alcohol dehydrogenase family)